MTLLSIPPTRAGIRHIEISLQRARFTQRAIDLVKRALIDEHVMSDRRVQPERRRQYEKAVRGAPGADGLEIQFERRMHRLVYTTAHAPVPTPLSNLRAGAMTRSAVDELDAIRAQTIITHESDNGTVTHKLELDPRFASLTSRANQGNPEALRALGIASVEYHAFPALDLETSSTIDATGGIHRVEVPQLSTVRDPCDVVELFEELRLGGLLPLASREDSVRMVMAVASPLVRHILPGQQGIYWFQGPAGSGKDLCIAMIKAIWDSVGADDTHVFAEIRDPKGEEDRKTLGAHPHALYVRLREAGKQPDAMIEKLITHACADEISTRVLYQNERPIPNTFAYVCDSVERVPERREIGRRTVVIKTSPPGFDVKTADLIHIATEKGPSIIASLADAIRRSDVIHDISSSPEGRPLLQVALARTFGAELDLVCGQSLDDIYLGILSYVQMPDAPKSHVSPSMNMPQIATQFDVYTSTSLVDTMKRQDGHESAFGSLKHGRFVFERINREAQYDVAMDKPGMQFFPVEVDGHRYGLRFLDARGSKFVFVRLDIDGTPRAIEKVAKKSFESQFSRSQPITLPRPFQKK